MSRPARLLLLGFFLIFTILTMLVTRLVGQTFGTPAGDVLNDGQPVTLGLRFVPKESGMVTGARFYRRFSGSVTIGLWRNGTLIASTQATDAFGLQTVLFGSAVPVAASQEYIISYFSQGGSYNSGTFNFPYNGPLYTSQGSRYTYGAVDAFPVSSYGNSNYYIEPVLQAMPAPQPPSQTVQIIRDTVYIPRDTCTIDYSRLADLQFTIMMQDQGGVAYIPDSTTVYRAIFGVAQPHIRLKEDASIRQYRFTRTYTINGVATPVRFTLYKTGAWIRERKNSAGIWEPF